MEEVKDIFTIGFVVGFTSLLYTATELLKRIEAGEWKSVKWQLIAYTLAVGITLLASQTDFAPGYSLGPVPFHEASVLTLVFVGLCFGGVGGVALRVGKEVTSLRGSLQERAERPPVTVVQQTAGTTQLAHATEPVKKAAPRKRSVKNA